MKVWPTIVAFACLLVSSAATAQLTDAQIAELTADLKRIGANDEQIESFFKTVSEYPPEHQIWPPPPVGPLDVPDVEEGFAGWLDSKYADEPVYRSKLQGRLGQEAFQAEAVAALGNTVIHEWMEVLILRFVPSTNLAAKGELLTPGTRGWKTACAWSARVGRPGWKSSAEIQEAIDALEAGNLTDCQIYGRIRQAVYRAYPDKKPAILAAVSRYETHREPAIREAVASVQKLLDPPPPDPDSIIPSGWIGDF